MKPSLMELDLKQSTASNLVPKADPTGPVLSDDWLRALNVGTHFLGQNNSQKGMSSGYILDAFVVLAKTEKSVWLYYVNQNIKLYVNSLRFSRNNELVEVLGVVQTGGEEKDEQHHRTDQPAGLEDNEEPS